MASTGRSPTVVANRRLLSRAQLFNVPVTPIIKHLKSLVVRKIDFAVVAKEIDGSSELNIEVLRPLIQHVRELENPSVVYCLLYLCRLFKEQAVEDSGAKELWRTRADICEIVATRILKWLSDQELLTVVFGEFSAKQAGTLPLPSKFAPTPVPASPAPAVPPPAAHRAATAPPAPRAPQPLSVPRTPTPPPEPVSSPAPEEELMDMLSKRAEDLELIDSDDEYEPYGLEVLEENEEEEGDGETAADDSRSVAEGTSALWGQNEEVGGKNADAKESALAVAVDARCLRFTSHPWVVELVNEVWNGRILFVRDEDAPPLPDDSPPELVAISENPEPTLAQLLNPLSAFDASRPRVPKWGYWVRVIHFASFLLFFSLVLHVRSYTVTWYEVVFYVISASYVLDELDQISDLGIRFYLSDLWTWLDLMIIAFLVAFYVLRALNLYYPPAPEPPVPVDPDDPSQGFYPPVVQGVEFTVLGFASCLVWPRFLSSLDRIQIFGIFTIVCREMLLDSLFFIIPCVFVLMGFTSALYSVVQGYARYFAEISYFKIMGDMAQVFTGLYWNVYDAAVDQGFPGYSLFYIVLFIGVVNILLTPFLIAIVTNSFLRIVERADAEYEFDLTYRVLESTLWQDEHPFLPPFNLIQILLYPFRLVLPRAAYRPLERAAFYALCWPLLVLVWLLEVAEAALGAFAHPEGPMRVIREGATPPGKGREKMGRELVEVVDGERRGITRLEGLGAAPAGEGQPAARSPRKSVSGPSEGDGRVVALLEALAGTVRELSGKLDEANAKIAELQRSRA
ncbi:hypothetical protein DFJ74DRAFT_766679 [Hyaloraphidium curvatum]|nr:hypothetical protein DFJ74DRAFT_766679 [Hyaloraphidium curvatum]